jgi:hypothetical protein
MSGPGKTLVEMRNQSRLSGRPSDVKPFPLRVLGTAVVAVLLAVAGGCGSADPETDLSSEPDPTAAWAEQVLEGEPGADTPTVLAVDQDQVIVITASDAGVISGFATDPAGRLRAGAATETGIDYLALGGAARLGEDWLAVGSGGLLDGEELLFDVHAFSSNDGIAWSPIDATGLDGPADVTGIAALDGGVVAVGALRTADDPASGGFQPVAWHSTDGEAWITVPLPTNGGSEGSVQAVATTGEEILAVGRVDDTGVMWSSTDSGTTWAIVERDGIPLTSLLADIAAQGDVLVASGLTPINDESEDESTQMLVRSTDGGHRWSEVAAPPRPNRGESFAFPLSVGGTQFFALGNSFIESWAEPELCYADIELCRQDSSVALYTSNDGDNWSRVDTSGIGKGDAGEVDDILATDDGRVIALQRLEQGTAAWTWPAGTPLPTESEPADPTSVVELLGENQQPELGRRYGVPLYIHCGMDWLYVGAEAWHRTDTGPDTETGAGDEIPDNWPVAQQAIFGFVTLVEDDLIEYSINDAEVIATYAPSTQQPPGCD